uniref:Uncharacterized protein n=1 Tax=Arundo donax TaxID=35708 RepID=A0A0A9HRT9_ARUDO
MFFIYNICIPQKGSPLLFSPQKNIGRDFESVAKCWLSNKKLHIVNMLSFVAMWGLWKLRNCLCFQNISWVNIALVEKEVILMIGDRKLLCHSRYIDAFNLMTNKLESLAAETEKLSM